MSGPQLSEPVKGFKTIGQRFTDRQLARVNFTDRQNTNSTGQLGTTNPSTVFKSRNVKKNILVLNKVKATVPTVPTKETEEDESSYSITPYESV